MVHAKGVGPFIAGFAVGDLVLAVGRGDGTFAVVAHEFATLFVALKFAGAAYLACVAWALARTPAVVDPDAEASARAWRRVGARFSLGAARSPREQSGSGHRHFFSLDHAELVVDLDAVSGVSIAEMAGNLRHRDQRDARLPQLAANRARRWFRSNRAMTAVSPRHGRSRGGRSGWPS